MSRAKIILINRHCLNNIDFMGYELQKDNKFTYHHIVKKEHGGGKNIKNGAILTENSHEYLHLIESKDYTKYQIINSLFKWVNESKKPPQKEIYIIINKLLTQFEEEHKNDLNKKGNKVIKEKYLRRVLNNEQRQNI